jgi:hypothetical protein
LEDAPIPGMHRASVEEVTRMIKEDEDRQKRVTLATEQILKGERGFSEEHAEGFS